jgi:hypothetical protein
VFTQTDPLPAVVGSPNESSYVYVGNNPLVYVDPAGTCRRFPTTSNPVKTGVDRQYVGNVSDSCPFLNELQDSECDWSAFKLPGET